MASPDNSSPPRPASVPAEARWDPKEPGFEWVVGDVDSDGRRHGHYRSWTRGGVLHGECGYDHGRVHGVNINFHPDGTPASEADWVDGVIMDSVFFRSDAPTPEPFAACAPNVWSVRYYTRDGKTNYTIRYFSRDGTECGPDGNALPTRPGRVSKDARWFPDMDRWVDGEIERGTNAQVGRWRWWSRDGVLRHEEIRDARGEPTLVAQYHADGSLEKKTTRDERGEQRDYHFDDGKLSVRQRSDPQGRATYKATWLPDGTLDEETTRTFDGDALASVVEKTRRGVLAFEARREGPSLACVLYHPDGKTIHATGLHTAGKLDGRWRVFDTSGALRREVDASALDVRHDATGRGLARRLGEALFLVDDAALDSPRELAGIDAEPWHETTGAYERDVERFPRLVRALVSPDAMVRDYAFGAIAREVIHQGSTYPATARVVPYLGRLLAHPTADHPRLLALLQQVADAALPFVDEVAHLDAGHDDRFAIEGTVRAVAAVWPYIYALFADASAEDRRRILVLAKLAPHAKPDIVELARNDRDPAMRAVAVHTLAELPTFVATDALPSLLDKDPLVRATAAIAVGLRLGPETPRECLHMLDEAIRGWRDVAKRFAELPFARTHVLVYAALAAGAIRTPDARSLTQQLCAGLDEVDGRAALDYGQGLLSLAFGTGERPFAKRFVEILDCLAKSAAFWMFDVNAREVLGQWHLPGTRTGLAALVTELRAAAEPEVTMHAKLHVSA
jgi:hypothetical protein